VSFDILFDPLFRTPFFVGLILSALLPLLGNLLRLRDEWLAALGLAYLAGATGLIGLAFGIPAVLGAPLGALGGAAVKAFGRYRGNTVYALMVLVGWCTTMLVAATVVSADAATWIAWLLSVCCLIHLLLVWGEHTMTHPTAHARLAISEMTGGRYRRYFWLGVGLMVGGVMAPWIGPAGAVFALVALLAHEHAYVQAGQSVPLA